MNLLLVIPGSVHRIHDEILQVIEANLASRDIGLHHELLLKGHRAQVQEGQGSQRSWNCLSTSTLAPSLKGFPLGNLRWE